MATAVELTANLDLDPWSDIVDDTPIGEGELSRIGMLPGGTAAGRAVVAMLVWSEGKPIVVQVTWRMWQTLNAGLAATPVAQMEEM